MKVGSYAVIATNYSKSDAFTKPREPKRQSVADEEDDNEQQPSTSAQRDVDEDAVNV